MPDGKRSEKRIVENTRKQELLIFEKLPLRFRDCAVNP